MARRVGFKTIEQQGWINAKTQKAGGAPIVNPYPSQSDDYWRFEKGVERFQHGMNYKGEKL